MFKSINFYIEGMSAFIFPTPSNIRSVIIEDVCAFSVSGILSKTVIDQFKIETDSNILILGTELHPSFPSTAQAWISLLQRNVIEYQLLVKEQQNENEDDFLANVLSRIKKSCDANKTVHTVLITNLTPLLLTNSSSKVSRLLGKSVCQLTKLFWQD